MSPPDAAAGAGFGDREAQELETVLVPDPISLVLIDDNRFARRDRGNDSHAAGSWMLAASADVEEALQKVRDATPR